MKLYANPISSASYRVRIALNLKGIAYEQVTVDPATGRAGDEDYRAVNPQMLVPALRDGDNIVVQSLAICEYLDEAQPAPPLLPRDPLERARVRQLALVVACEIHPLNNPRVRRYLTTTIGASSAQELEWYRHWVGVGFGALETMLARSRATGRFCHGDEAGLADVFLVPQVFNANRYGVGLATFPTIRRINDECLKLAPFQSARPENQPGFA